MEGRTPEAIYNGYAACPIVTDYGHVIMAEFDYDKKEQITFPLSLFDMSKEQWIAWALKVYGLKHIYFNLMLNGLY
jgi:sulfide:quinone oxidoreductase